MASSSSDNLMMTMLEQHHPWLLRPTTLTDWITPDMNTMLFADEAETVLTKTLFQSSSLSADHSFNITPDDQNTLLNYSKPDNIPTVSGGSENEVPVRKQNQLRRSLPPSGRVGKRRPRPSKRAKTTTFIVADPDNFRQMVQQVTGLNVGDAPLLQAQQPPICSTGFVVNGSASANAAAGRYLEISSSCSFPTLESWSV